MSDMDDPLVSVVTAVYNGAEFIEDNILSVKNQKYPHIEHIIIDGGSRDGTVDIIKRYAGTYNLRWVSEKDGGVYDAFNKGFMKARGDIFTWLDGDNYFHSNVVESVMDIFRAVPAVDIVHGDVDIVDYHGKYLRTYRAPNISFRNALIKNTSAIPLQPAAFFRKEWYQKANGFDLRYPIAADYDFWLNVLQYDPRVYCFHKVLGSYRRGKNANSQSVRGVMRGMEEMLVIGAIHHQPAYARLLMVTKYSFGLISAFIKKFFYS